MAVAEAAAAVVAAVDFVRDGPPTIFAVEIPQRRGDSIVLSTDEGVRGATTAELLAGLRPGFYREGADTAGNASTSTTVQWKGVRPQAMAEAMGAQASAPSASSTLAMCMAKGSGGIAPLSAPA